MLKISKKNIPLKTLVLGTLLASLSTITHADTLDRLVIATGGEQIAVGSNTLAYTIGQPFVATPSPEPLQIGFWAGQTGDISELPPPSTCEDSPKLTFIGLKDSYEVGETLELSLQACLHVEPFHRVDLWVVLQMPAGSFLYMTPLPLVALFSPVPQAFQESLEILDTTYQLLQVTLPPGIGGDYTFYSAFIEEGKNPITDGLTVLRSELAVASTVLSNR